MRKPLSLEWSWALLAGVLAGFAVAMTAVDAAARAAPGLLAPGSRAPTWATAVCLVGATLLLLARNQAPGREPAARGRAEGDAG